MVDARLRAGAVALSGTLHVLVLAIGGGRAATVPIRRETADRRRGDVPVRRAEIGVLIGAVDPLVIRCDSFKIVPVDRLRVFGLAPAAILATCIHAALRAKQNAAIEQGPPIRCTLLEQSCISHGRKKGGAGGV